MNKVSQFKKNSSQIEDKENKRESTNKQLSSSGVGSASAANLLKRSKTTDPSRAPLRQKDVTPTSLAVV